MTGQATILVAEDNPTNLILIETLLEKMGHKVIPAINGQVAFDIVMGGTLPDLVLMDLDMPGIDGHEATRQIRAIGKHTFNLPIIALTAHDLDEDRTQSWEAGMNDFLTKPVQHDLLNDVVTGWLSDSPPVLEGMARLGMPVFDKATLDEMLEDLDDETIEILMDEFVNEVTTRLDAIKSAADARDATGLQHVCHALKSSSGTFGAMRLARLCGQVEAAALTGDNNTALSLAAWIAPVAGETSDALGKRDAA